MSTKFVLEFYVDQEDVTGKWFVSWADLYSTSQSAGRIPTGCGPYCDTEEEAIAAALRLLAWAIEADQQDLTK